MRLIRVRGRRRGLSARRQGLVHRLTLRPLARSDAPQYAQLTQMPGVARWALRGRRAARAGVARQIASASQRDWRRQGVGLWAVVPASDRHRLVGACGLSWIGLLQRYELFFCLDPALWGAGVATACVRAVLAHADTHVPGAGVFALTDPAHAAAQRVLCKSGFVRRAELRHAGRPAVYYVRSAPAVR